MAEGSKRTIAVVVDPLAKIAVSGDRRIKMRRSLTTGFGFQTTGSCMVSMPLVADSIDRIAFRGIVEHCSGVGMSHSHDEPFGWWWIVGSVHALHSRSRRRRLVMLLLVKLILHHHWMESGVWHHVVNHMTVRERGKGRNRSTSIGSRVVGWLLLRHHSIIHAISMGWKPRSNSGEIWRWSESEEGSMVIRMRWCKTTRGTDSILVFPVVGRSCVVRSRVSIVVGTFLL
mmetsp:Transcript_22680/g.63107  ORF Transcript_22680/g.63107 Transcript_22680/m.63107 type:complete len:229 (-) Transcript_22680:223-909(-)